MKFSMKKKTQWTVSSNSIFFPGGLFAFAFGTVYNNLYVSVCVCVYVAILPRERGQTVCCSVAVRALTVFSLLLGWRFKSDWYRSCTPHGWENVRPTNTGASITRTHTHARSRTRWSVKFLRFEDYRAHVNRSAFRLIYSTLHEWKHFNLIEKLFANHLIHSDWHTAARFNRKKWQRIPVNLKSDNISMWNFSWNNAAAK